MERLFKIIIFCSCFIGFSANANNNAAAAYCLQKFGYKLENFDTFDFSKAAGCFQDIRAQKRKEDMAELRDFLKHNPRYRYPGQSLNKCFGKPKEMPFEKSELTVGPGGMSAKVWYKDKLSANCYENAPWDNRDEN